MYQIDQDLENKIKEGYLSLSLREKASAKACLKKIGQDPYICLIAGAYGCKSIILKELSRYDGYKAMSDFAHSINMYIYKNLM